MLCLAAYAVESSPPVLGAVLGTRRDTYHEMRPPGAVAMVVACSCQEVPLVYARLCASCVNSCTWNRAFRARICSICGVFAARTVLGHTHSFGQFLYCLLRCWKTACTCEGWFTSTL